MPLLASGKNNLQKDMLAQGFPFLWFLIKINFIDAQSSSGVIFPLLSGCSFWTLSIPWLLIHPPGHKTLNSEK